MNLHIKYCSLTEALSESFNLYLKNLRLLVPITLLTILLMVCIAMFYPTILLPNLWHLQSVYYANKPYYTYHIHTNLTLYHYLGILLVSIYKAFMTNLCFKIYDNRDNKKLRLSDFFEVDFDIFAYLVARLRYTLTTLVGLFLFLIPGLIWVAKYYVANYFIIDKKLSIIESFTASSLLTSRVKTKLWLFLLIKAFIFNLAFTSFSILTIVFVYIVLFLPIITFAKISLYRQLLHSKPL